MKDLVYACLAEFGMRPAKAMQEREVIQEIFRRYVQCCARIGRVSFYVFIFLCFYDNGRFRSRIRVLVSGSSCLCLSCFWLVFFCFE